MKKALLGLTGVKDVTIDSKQDLFKISYDATKATAGELEQAILDAAIAQGTRNLIERISH